MHAHWLKRLLHGEGGSKDVNSGVSVAATPRDLASTEPREPLPPVAGIPHAEHAHRVDMPLHHLVNTSEATRLLLQHFKCDDWYVACRNEHLLVLRLTRKGIPQYAVSYRCTPEVEKAVFHGSKTWAVSVIPLHSRDELTPEEIREVKVVLEQASAAEQHHSTPLPHAGEQPPAG